MLGAVGDELVDDEPDRRRQRFGFTNATDDISAVY
jgi:hypothetical protein